MYVTIFVDGRADDRRGPPGRVHPESLTEAITIITLGQCYAPAGFYRENGWRRPNLPSKTLTTPPGINAVSTLSRTRGEPMYRAARTSRRYFRDRSRDVVAGQFNTELVRDGMTHERTFVFVDRRDDRYHPMLPRRRGCLMSPICRFLSKGFRSQEPYCIYFKKKNNCCIIFLTLVFIIFAKVLR